MSNNNPLNVKDDDIKVSEILRLITSLDVDTISQIWEGFCFYFAFQYLSEDKIRIPLIGDLTIKDKKVIFTEHENLKNIISQLDEANINRQITNIDIFKLLQKRMKANLQDNEIVKNKNNI